MSRSDVLSARAVALLEANHCTPEYPRAQLESELALANLPFTSEQLETVANLWNVRYLSRSSFATPRFDVWLFHGNRGESISDYVPRRSIWSESIAYVGDCETDETNPWTGKHTHGADGGARICALDQVVHVVIRLCVYGR